MGRNGTQVKFSDKMDWWCQAMSPRQDMESIPFVGEVAGVTPALAYCNKESRRRDVGVQKYGSNTPSFNSTLQDRNGLLIERRSAVTDRPTSHGDIRLTSNDRDLGFMPSADAILFLRHEYRGSRATSPPRRYFPG